MCESEEKAMNENANVEKKSAQITLEELRAKPFGVLETREFRYQDDVSTYFWAKQKENGRRSVYSHFRIFQEKTP